MVRAACDWIIIVATASLGGDTSWVGGYSYSSSNVSPRENKKSTYWSTGSRKASEAKLGRFLRQSIWSNDIDCNRSISVAGLVYFAILLEWYCNRWVH
mmetsp:Transcript_26783/g.56550  ORF Transcript_26783/g.56550 Transcript_26783/m.56550 type:complete len:98 (-) Transcript_26783:40-333(-)